MGRAQETGGHAWDKKKGVRKYQSVTFGITILLLEIIRITTTMIIINPATVLNASQKLISSFLREVIALIIIFIPILEKKKSKPERLNKVQ